MADFVTIANLAASSLGEDDQLRSPDDDTHLSRSVKAVWDVERQAAIRDHTWNFAMRRAVLAQVAGQDASPYAAVYRLPATSLRLVEVLGYRRADYQLEGPFILSSAPAPLRIRYLVDVPEPAEWDAMFAKVFAMRVAWQIADRITGDTGRVQIAERKYLAALREAKRVDARENPPVPFEPGTWELSRGGVPERVDSNGFIWP
ncbi:MULTISPECIES: hypothetical protein [unclassified Sphingomonas]|uniref:hypothetical protein n=1 Tax=unclassified Sphingomonas TaxID=196159 RepID=UPI0009260BAB|nr:MULTISPECIES: hypothetical protein [unclassified Sphingomonas]MBN8848155.1 hypothetical protein [Sphingomonas sp.]OJV30650.1 MAG: hypothetical protein BGO24_08015 [Sphingomonas sp. 67-36]